MSKETGINKPNSSGSNPQRHVDEIHDEKMPDLWEAAAAQVLATVKAEHPELANLALAVINDAGRPVGVVSRTDIVRRESKPSGTTNGREIMTPTVVSVRPDDPAWEVIAKTAAFKVHRLFVVDHTGFLTGVISAFDVVRKLRRTP
jgi:CBS domain-containing protein